MAGKKTGKRLLTWVLVLVMALSLLPLNALAAEADEAAALQMSDEDNSGDRSLMPAKTTYTITFKASGGKLNNGNETFDATYNSEKALVKSGDVANSNILDENPSNPPCVFQGWFYKQFNIGIEKEFKPQSTKVNDVVGALSHHGTIYAKWSLPDGFKEASIFYLKDPTKNRDSNTGEDWNGPLGGKEAGFVDIANLSSWEETKTWGDWRYVENCFTVSTTDVTWPTGFGTPNKDGLELNKGSTEWNAIFEAFKTKVEADNGGISLTKDEVDSITLVPYKVSRYNSTGGSYHVDCEVEIQCKEIFTVKFFFNNGTTTDQLKAMYCRQGNSINDGDIPTTNPAPDGYEFDGWYTSDTFDPNTKVTFPLMPNANVDLYARYKAIETPNPEPADPELGVNFKYDKNIVDVICETTNNHNASYGLKNGYYTVSDRKQLSNGNWQCKITIDLAKYFELYNSDSQHPGHTRDMKHEKATAIKTIYPTWSAKSRQWSCAESLIDAAEIYVKCDAVTPPTEPSKDYIKELLGSNAVQIICTNVESGHGSKTFGLIDGTFSIVYSGYNCEVKIDPFNEYVEEFNTVLDVAQGTHISDASKADQSIINLRWVNGKWTVMDAPAKHHVLCVTPKYTVTYTDGVGGEEVFADQVYRDLRSGTATPAFNGTPTRTDYVFAGWKPEVAEKVTENATYAAQWKEDKNHNGIPDENDDKYTVTYTDGVGGEEVFADQVYENRLSGTATPAFSGTPARDGYRFTGWEPEVSDTVTGNVTYAAQWTPRTDLSYTVHYYLKNTTKPVANDKRVNGQTFNAVVKEEAIRISGYRVYGDSVKSITIGTGTNEIIFYYTRASRPSTPSKPTLNTGDHYAYVMGYPDGTVRPNGSITRAEVSAILFRLLSYKTRDEYFTTESSFTDVKAGAWYNNSIATLEKAGVIVDTAKGGAFRPNEAITRAELAAMLAQFSDAKPVKGVKFSDVSAEHWAYEAIAIAAKMGWIEGYPDGTFRPDATITRAEMMTLVNRALERVPSDEDHLLSKRVMLTFPDCKSGDWFYIAVQEATNSHTYERAATEKNGDEQWTALRANRDWTLLEK